MHRRKFIQNVTAAGMCALTATVRSEDQSDVPLTVRGVSTKEAGAISQILKRFLETQGATALSLAVAYRGKLKLLATAGHADLARSQSVNAEHLFRIASVSKPITSAVILRLVEQRKLTPQMRLFGERGLLKRFNDVVAATSEANQRRLRELTIEHLLEHTGGGWRNRAGDPMFAREAITLEHEDLIRWTIKNRPLENDPGKAYAYSNFGYCLLGRVIEAVTGAKYERAVIDLMLKPCGVKNMHVGKRTRADRHEQEVEYFGQREDPYGAVMRVARMDSHGGWIASPADLLRFATHVDGFAPPADVLSSRAIKYMSTASPVTKGYAKGWQVNAADNWWHLGEFNGGSAILARISDGHCWAAMVNTRANGGALDGLPWEVKRAVGRWGDHDFF